MERLQEVLARLPGKDCGQCGFATCAGLAAHALTHADALGRCVHLAAVAPAPPTLGAPRPDEITWKDILGRDYELVLEPLPEDPGPRETLLPFNPCNVERLGIRKGDVVYGRPTAVGCPVTHVGEVMADPDPLSATLEWCLVGPLAARGRGIEIGAYTPVAYDGLVRHARVSLQIGRRCYFLPHRCMLQSRHSGVITALAQRPEGMRVRLEGIWIA
jgi:uncharacterized protein